LPRGVAGAVGKIAPGMSFTRHASTRSVGKCNVTRQSLQYPVQHRVEQRQMRSSWLPRFSN
jgi:hypothetical protein